MSALTVRSLLSMTENELERLRVLFRTISKTATQARRQMFAEFLARREHQTIQALRRYRESEGDAAVLDVHLRLGWAFPLASLPSLDASADIQTMLEVAQGCDERLGELRERVELYASSAQLRSLFTAVDDIVAKRQHELSAVLHELRERPPARKTRRNTPGFGRVYIERA